jgi:hypothetical protein
MGEQRTTTINWALDLRSTSQGDAASQVIDESPLRQPPQQLALHVRLIADITSCPFCAMCGRLRVGKSFFTFLQHWSVQPCVRPIGAVHMTAGHNALRGSGPGQKPAFDDALARVGCPDRRIDRLCITCCSPSNLHITPGVRRDLVIARARRVLCNARPWPSWSRPCARFYWQAR